MDADKKLGPYKLVREIGSGVFGTVWLAEKVTPIATLQVALKLPHTKKIDLEALKREAAIWIQAGGHPNVLRLIDADIYDNQVVIVSEYVPDGSLSKWLEGHGGTAPSIEAASEMIVGILAGLEHLHERQIIHRDLKPDNILLQGSVPLLTDFGISRLLQSSSYSLTIGGTPVYMAPEAFNFKRNKQTDIWSVGIIFYQLLTGRLPYYNSDVESLKEAITRDKPAPLPMSIPALLRQIVEKALEHHPTRRYRSAAEMRRDLQAATFKLRLAMEGAMTISRAEANVSTLVSTLITPDSSPPPVSIRSVHIPKGELHQKPRPKPTMKQRLYSAFWLFWGQQPSLPLKTKLKRILDQMFWESMGLACCISTIFTLVFTFGGGKNVRDVASIKIPMIAFYLFCQGMVGFYNVKNYLDWPEKEPEIIYLSHWNDDEPWGLRARWRLWTTGALLTEILCITGKYFWDPSLSW